VIKDAEVAARLGVSITRSGSRSPSEIADIEEIPLGTARSGIAK
jgi:hypothetical protein